MFVFSYLKVGLVIAVILAVMGLYVYIKSLQSDLAISESNNIKLELALDSEKKVVKQQREDTTKIVSAINQQNDLTTALTQSVDGLKDKFNKTNASGEKRDVGNLATVKTAAIQRIINRGTANALRCLEISTGSPLTEKEKNATRKSEINSECPELSNPSYVPYSN